MKQLFIFLCVALTMLDLHAPRFKVVGKKSGNIYITKTEDGVTKIFVRRPGERRMIALRVVTDDVDVAEPVSVPEQASWKRRSPQGPAPAEQEGRRSPLYGRNLKGELIFLRPPSREDGLRGLAPGYLRRSVSPPTFVSQLEKDTKRRRPLGLGTSCIGNGPSPTGFIDDNGAAAAEVDHTAQRKFSEQFNRLTRRAYMEEDYSYESALDEARELLRVAQAKDYNYDGIQGRLRRLIQNCESQLQDQSKEGQ